MTSARHTINQMIRTAARGGIPIHDEPDDDEPLAGAGDGEHQDDDSPITADPDQGQGVHQEPRHLTMNDRIRAAVGVQPW